MIFYFMGPSETGKDSFLNYLKGYVDADLIDSSYEAKSAANYFGWDGVKDERGRTLIASIYEASFNYNQGPVLFVQKQLAASQAPIQVVMVRQYEVLTAMQSNFLGKTVFFDRPSHTVLPLEMNFLNGFPCTWSPDIIIRNLGTLEDLKLSARNFVVKHILGGNNEDCR